jgi:hypothetical protein
MVVMAVMIRVFLFIFLVNDTDNHISLVLIMISVISHARALIHSRTTKGQDLRIILLTSQAKNEW